MLSLKEINNKEIKIVQKKKIELKSNFNHNKDMRYTIKSYF